MDDFPDSNYGKLNNDDFEQELARRSEELIAQRREYYKNKGDRKRSVQIRAEKKFKRKKKENPEVETPDTSAAPISWKNGRRLGRKGRELESEELTIYKAKAALVNYSGNKIRPEGAIHRTFRLIKNLIVQHKKMKRQPLYTAERRRKAYGDIFRDCWGPVADFLDGMEDCLWDFLSQFAKDFWDCILFIGDIIITIAYYGGSLALYLWDWVWEIRLWLEKHKRQLFGAFVISVSCIAFGAVFYSSIVAYEYSYYGKTLGVAKTKEDVYRTIDVLGDKLAEANGANITLDVERDIEFKRVYGLRMAVDSPDDILNTLTYMKDLQVRAFAINVNGEQLVILENQETAENVLKAIKSDNTSKEKDIEVKTAEFVEDIEIEEVGVLLGDIWNALDAKRYLETGSIKVQDKNAITRPFINVLTTEIQTYYEPIDFGVKYISNSNLYSDEQELVSEGILGENEIGALVSKRNGREIAREVVSTTRVSEPVDAVMYQGTKPIPPSDGTGTFIYPVKNYTITSKFGPRWGRMHNGVDLAAPTGTKIYASDGGRVTFAGWKSSFGYVVIIDHGGLYETLYAHCSKILVNAGDEVYQDKTIALVGSTGNSTGPHLHFEVHYKGVAYNPLNYLP